MSAFRVPAGSLHAEGPPQGSGIISVEADGRSRRFPSIGAVTGRSCEVVEFLLRTSAEISLQRKRTMSRCSIKRSVRAYRPVWVV